MVTITGIWIVDNEYKNAFCKECNKPLKNEKKIVSVAKVQGKHSFISNYHLGCSKEIVEFAHKQTKELLNNLITVSQEIGI